MIDFENIIGFEWDKGNSIKNTDKHGILNSEAEQIFFNVPLIIAEDAIHSTISEKRYAALGITDDDKTITVIFTVRKNLIRVISARKMSKKEREIYNEKS